LEAIAAKLLVGCGGGLLARDLPKCHDGKVFGYFREELLRPANAVKRASRRFCRIVFLDLFDMPCGVMEAIEDIGTPCYVRNWCVQCALRIEQLVFLRYYELHKVETGVVPTEDVSIIDDDP
jgi:hypothetical protein